MIFCHILLLVIAFLTPSITENTWNAHDILGYHHKMQTATLALELMKDAKLKVRQIMAIIDEHSVVVQFQVGYILGQIREKYKHMLETYRETKDWYTNKTQVPGSGFRTMLPLHYFIRMEMIHTKEVDIDKMVHVLEVIPEKLLLAPNSLMMNVGKKWSKHFNSTGHKTNSTTNSTNLLLRSRDDAAMLAIWRQEEELKSKYREQYTQKKLGLLGKDDNNLPFLI